MLTPRLTKDVREINDDIDLWEEQYVKHIYTPYLRLPHTNIILTT